jgi:hypothetical protein
MLIDVKTPSTSFTQNTDVTFGTPQYFSYKYILWRSVLVVPETGVNGEKHRPVASH